MGRQQISFIPALSPKEYDALLLRYANSAVMQRYIRVLSRAALKPLSLKSCVESIYGSTDEAGYKKNLNRFYKLRKKLGDDYTSTHIQQSPNRHFTEEEQKREQCRKLLAAGDFYEAEKQLAQLQATCERNNIFELLSDVIDLRIYVLQSVNNLQRTKPLYKAHALASDLLKQLNSVKRLGRQIYEANLRHGAKGSAPLLKQVDKIANRHKAWPRFRLIYNYLSAYYKIGEGGERMQVPNNVIARHLGALKQSFIANPGMPVLNYLPGYQLVQQYRLKEMESILQYRMYRFRESAQLMDALIDELKQAGNATGGMLSETMFLNAIHLHVAAGEGEEALAVVRRYIQFIRANKLLDMLPRAYCEMANVYTTLDIKVPVATLLKLLNSVTDYERMMKQQPLLEDAGALNLLKCKLLWSIGERKEALKLYNTPAVKSHFANDALWQLILDTLNWQLNAPHLPEKQQELSIRIKRLKFQTEKPSERSTYIWVDVLLKHGE